MPKRKVIGRKGRADEKIDSFPKTWYVFYEAGISWKRNIFSTKKRLTVRKEKVCKGSGDKHVSYSLTTLGDEEVEKYSIWITSRYLPEAGRINHFNANSGLFFKAHVASTHGCLFYCKQCVVCFQVCQRCRSLGTTLGPHPQLFTKDHHCISRQETLLNFWEEMHTVHFGRY